MMSVSQRRWSFALALTLFCHLGAIVLPVGLEANTRVSESTERPVVVRLAIQPTPQAPPVTQPPTPKPPKPKKTKPSKPKPKKRRRKLRRKSESIQKPPAPSPIREESITPPTNNEEVKVAHPTSERQAIAQPRAQQVVRLDGYWRGFKRLVESHKRYPRIAQELRLEGVVEIRVTLDRTGRMVGEPKIARSSGHSVLDKEALRMLRAARDSGFTVPLPRAWREATASVVLPFSFRLRS